MKIAILDDDQDTVRTLDAEDLAAMPSTTCWLRCSVIAILSVKKAPSSEGAWESSLAGAQFTCGSSSPRA